MIEPERTTELKILSSNLNLVASQREELYSEIDESIRYLDGLKGYCNRVVDFEYIMSLRSDVTFGDFMEGVDFLIPDTDYAGLHVTDPNWYEEGGYESGAIEPALLQKLERYFRRQRMLEDNQTLDPIVHYTPSPTEGRWIEGAGRPNMLINVSGGERDDWGQFIKLWLEDGFYPFKLDTNPRTIQELKKLARENGKQEITPEEHWAAYHERKKIQENK